MTAESRGEPVPLTLCLTSSVRQAGKPFDWTCKAWQGLSCGQSSCLDLLGRYWQDVPGQQQEPWVRWFTLETTAEVDGQICLPAIRDPPAGRGSSYMLSPIWPYCNVKFNKNGPVKPKQYGAFLWEGCAWVKPFWQVRHVQLYPSLAMRLLW